ncbi:MAG TPA: GNAT family N-acetyltransferase [Thermoanaerobaculia bacterium]
MEIEIRDAGPDDPAVLALVEALRDEVESRGAHNGVARPEISLAEAIRADCDTLLAYAGSEPVGTAGLKALAPGMGEIKRMYVAPAHRGAGIAGRMLAELERRACARGLEAIRLDTHDRLSEATGMYGGAGYRQIQDYNSNPRSNRWFEKLLA